MFRTVAIFAFAALCLIFLIPVAIDGARWLKTKYLTLMGPEPYRPMATRTPVEPQPPQPESEPTTATDKPKTEDEL